MIVLAVLCLALVTAMVILLVFGGFDSSVTIDWDLVNLAWQTNALVVFLAGALTLLVAEFALVLLGRGTRRKVEQRRELKRLRRVEQESTTGSRQGQPTQPATRTAPTQVTPVPQTTSTQAGPPQAASRQGSTSVDSTSTDPQATSNRDTHGEPRP